MLFQQADACVGDDHGIDFSALHLVVHRCIIQQFNVVGVADFFIQLFFCIFVVVLIHAVLDRNLLSAQVINSCNIGILHRDDRNLDHRFIALCDDGKRAA